MDHGQYPHSLAVKPGSYYALYRIELHGELHRNRDSSQRPDNCERSVLPQSYAIITASWSWSTSSSLLSPNVLLDTTCYPISYPIVNRSKRYHMWWYSPVWAADYCGWGPGLKLELLQWFVAESSYIYQWGRITLDWRSKPVYLRTGIPLLINAYWVH